MNRQRATNGKSKTRPARRKKFPWLVALAWAAALGSLAAACMVGAVLVYFDNHLPDFRQLTDYKPPLITRVYDRNGDILAEYADERRVWVPINEIPKPLIDAFLSAEDSHFYEHGGFDVKAIIRAALNNLLGHHMQGASTITQQVAKTYLLSSERTYTRKIKELLLSWRIEKAYTKDQILELYLNRIYLGNGSYGVAAAAQTYFSKTLKELTIPERAMIAGMPQAPTRYNPVRHPQMAVKRRNIVIRRMEDEDYISKAEADAAVNSPLGLKVQPLKQGEDAPHFAEYIRQLIARQYGEDALYKGGLSVYTTLDLPTQRYAEQAVYQGLRDFDRRHGWRGPLKRLNTIQNWQEEVDKLADDYAHSWRIGEPAVVLKVGPNSTRVGLSGDVQGIVPASTMKWTGHTLANTILKQGDVIFVKATGDNDKKAKLPTYSLEQLPMAQSAMVVMDVKTGEVLAMVGGLGEGVGFNRALMAKRQVGSSFKPFVYTAALDKGYTPASLVLDAPIVFRNSDGQEWKPHNYENNFNGLIPMRKGLEKSLNLMTLRLAQDVGMRNVAQVANSMGITSDIPITDLSVALGTVDISLIDMVTAYSVFPRGGTYVAPTFLRRVQDSQGVTLYRAHPACENCLAQLGASEASPPDSPQTQFQQVISPQVAYQMVSMLQGVVQRGTGHALSSLGRPLAGKTGTTNDYVDAWFVGFSPSLAIGVWVGYDHPKSLGRGETGARAALPIWKAFAQKYFADKPIQGFKVPPGIDFVRIDEDSGLLPGVNTKHIITEAFVSGTSPSGTTPAYVDNPLGGYEDQYEGGNGSENGDGGALKNLLRTFGIY